jgi:sulfopyruvate decarboxylase TPP-binding subunit
VTRILLHIYVPSVLMGFGLGMLLPTLPVPARAFGVAPAVAAQGVTALLDGLVARETLNRMPSPEPRPVAARGAPPAWRGALTVQLVVGASRTGVDSWRPVGYRTRVSWRDRPSASADRRGPPRRGGSVGVRATTPLAPNEMSQELPVVTVDKAPLNAQVMIDTLKQSGATHLVWLPDTESGYLYQTLSDDPDLTLVPVAREGETFAIALGLLVGGKKPVVCIQSTGLFESGDSVRGLWIDLKLPIMALIGYRGYEGGGPTTDSAATFLEPILKAWGIPYEVVETDRQVKDVVPRMYRQAQERPGPAAVLIGTEYGA